MYTHMRLHIYIYTYYIHMHGVYVKKRRPIDSADLSAGLYSKEAIALNRAELVRFLRVGCCGRFTDGMKNMRTDGMLEVRISG